MLEAYHVEASKRELEAIQKEPQQKREGERARLKEAWANDKYLKSVKKAIRDHHKAPGNNDNISAFATGMNGIGGDSRHGNTGMSLPMASSMKSPRTLDAGSDSGPP